MANYFDQFDAPQEGGNYFDQFDDAAPAPKQDRSFIGAAAESGVRSLLAAGARVVDELNPFTLSEGDAAVLFKNDPKQLEEFTKNSAAMVLGRFAQEQTKRAREVMQQVDPAEKAISGTAVKDLEYATLDPEKAAYLSPTRVAGDVLNSLPTTVALAFTAYLTKGRANVAAAEAEQVALARGLSQEAAKTAAREAAIKQGAETMAKVGAASEAAAGYGVQRNQTLDEVMSVPQAQLDKSPAYQRLIEGGYSPEAARLALADSVSQEAGLVAGAVNAGTNLIGGRFLGELIGEGGTLLRRTGKGGLIEAATETVQSGGEQLGANLAMQAVDPTLSPFKGVGEAMAAGGVIGGVTGGATAGLFGSRQREGVVPPVATPAPDAQADFGAAVDQLQAAVDPYLGITNARSTDEAVAGAAAAADVDLTPPDVLSLAERRAMVDRQTELLAQADQAGTAFDRESALAQAETALPEAREMTASQQFADLTPMDARQAGLRLTVMRDMGMNAGENVLDLAVVPHPAQAGKFAIGRVELPSLDLETAQPAVTPQEAQNRLESAALVGAEQTRRAEDAPRQQMIGRAMAAIEARGGVASPYEAEILRAAGMGQPFNRIDPAAGRPASADEQLTAATGIAVGQEAGVGFGARESTRMPPPAAPFQYSPQLQGQQREQQELPIVDRAQAFVNVMARENTPAARAFTQAYTAGRITTADVQSALEQREADPTGGRLVQAAQQAPGAPAMPTESALTPMPASPELQEAMDLYGNRPYTQADLGSASARLGASAAVGERALQRAGAQTTDQRLAAAAAQGRLERPTQGRIIISGAKLSTRRDPVPGSTGTVNDGGVQHAFTVVDPSRVGNTGRMLQQIGRIFGKRLVVFQSDTLQADGFVLDNDSRNIYVNAQSQISPLAVFGHEMTHLIKRDNAAAYAALENVIRRNLREGAVQEFAAEAGYSEQQSLEEISSDLMGNRFQEADFWEQVFGEIARQNPTEAPGIIQRLSQAIQQAIAKFISAMRASGFDTDKYVADADAVKAALRQAVADYAVQQRDTAQSVAREAAPAGEAADLGAAQATFSQSGERQQQSPAKLSRERATPETWKAKPADIKEAKAYERANGILPYTSEGQIPVPLEGDGAKFSVKRPYTAADLAKGKLGNDPATGLPLNLNGTVTLYFPTNNATARELTRTKRLMGATPAANRIYLTNESSGPKVMNEPGNIDHAMDGANVLLQVDPSLLHLDQEYADGRKDFFIPIAEGQAFASKMTKLFTLGAPRTRALSKDTKLTDLERRIDDAITQFRSANAATKREWFKQARRILKEQHNVGTLLGVNGKLEKTNLGGYGINNYNGKDVMSMGLGLASAQKINEKNLSTCPNSAICEGLCLGETSGQNLLYGGEGQFKSGPRLSQYLKTEALVQNPEAFAIVLHSEIERFQRAAAKEDYQATVRLNVTSDFRPQTFRAIIDAFPGVMFYDYTKLPTNAIAANHHLTYSSTGASQVVNGKTIVNPESNWDKMVDERLSKGLNVAMAFTSRTDMPKYIRDERTGNTFQVWDGDNYDARFLDPKPGQPGNEFDQGMIIGLTNKDKTTKPEDAAEKHKGFFLDYDPARDGDTLVIRNQKQLATGQAQEQPVRITRRSETENRAQLSRARAPNTPEFRNWFGDSVVVDNNGEPRVVYHGTGNNFDEFSLSYRREDQGNDQFGPGYYTATSATGASGYANGESPNVMPLYMRLENPLESDAPAFSRSVIERLMRASPDFEDALTNFGDVSYEGERKVVRGAVDAYTIYEEGLAQLRTLQGDFWPDNPEGFLRAAAEITGHDGVVVDNGGAGKFYIAWSSNQLKSATGNSGEFSRTDNQITKSTRRPGTSPFYSQLERVIADVPERLATQPAPQWKAWLASNAAKLGVKKDEIEWTGINDYLDLRGKDKVSKADIAEYLKANGAQVEEVMKGEGDWAVFDGDENQYFATRREAEDYASARGINITEDTVFRGTNRPGGYGAKYSAYTLPGGENYRELLLTLPGATKQYAYDAFNPRTQQSRQFKTRAEAQSFANEDETGNTVVSEVEVGRPDYRSSHWDEANIIAHVRMNDRTDADGNKVLFIEELQSDWAQDGRKKGFAGNLSKEEQARKDRIDRGEDVTSEDFDWYNRRINDATTPAAPFVQDTKSWLSLGVKRMIAYAVDNGYDKVAFINGEQSADRYDLSKQVDSLLYAKNTDGTYAVSALTGGRGNMLGENIAEDKLEDYVGKEIAKKIVDGGGTRTQVQGARGYMQELKGVDLKVGGEGMKSFYDKIVPQVVADVLKKVGGGKLEAVRFTPETYYVAGKRDDVMSPEQQPGFAITDAMREKVAEGLPLFSRRRNIFNQPAPLTNWTAPTESKMDDVLYTLQDKQIDTKRVVDAIKRSAGAIANRWNPYLQEELYHGRTAKQTKDFLNDDLRPMLQELQARGVGIADFEEYLHNRHAEERNRQIAKVNPAMPDGGSGIDTADARAYLAGLDPAKRRAFEAIAKRVDAMTAATRKLLADSGLETPDTISKWEQAYSQYVPLQREDLDFSSSLSGAGTGQGYSVRGAASKRATGSSRPVVDILANIAMQRERAIVRAEKNRVAQAVYGLAVQNPNTDFWFAVDPAGQKDPAQAIAALIQMGINPMDAENIIQEPTQTYIDPRTGLVAQRINPALRGSANVLAARINGEDKYVFFNANDERSQRMATALKNLDADQLGRAMGMVATATRYIASVNTQYNPIFGAVNFLRDTQGAMLNLSSTPLAGKQKAVLGNVIPALKGIYADVRAERKGRGQPAGVWSQLWEEFQQEGGQTGYRDQFSRSAERAEALEKELNRNREGKAKQFGRAVFDWLSDYNETMENAVRLAAYKQAVDQGMTKQEAASLGKNLTVNFNRKGQIATQAGALYAFFNASVQGSKRLHETLTGPAGKKILGGGLLLGAMQAVLLAAAGYDEDEPPEFVRERNLLIPLKDGKYLQIPMPLGLHIIPNTSRVLTEFVLSGFRNPAQRIGQITGALLDAFNPIGNAGWSVQTLTPTLVDPIAALSENRDFTGKPIAKDDRSSLAPTPGYLRTRETASWFSKQLSYYLNLATGGTEFKKGLLSPTPDQIDYLIGQATGGVGREAMKVEQSVTSAVTGEELPSYKIPLFGRFYGDTKSSAAESNRFYANITDLNEHEAEIKGRRKSGQGGIDEYRRENPEARLVNQANSIDTQVRELKEKKRRMVERGASKESIKLLEAQITARMKRFNDRVRDAKESAAP